MTTAAGWAFLVARGRTKGYRSVLAPDFLVRDRRHTLLTEQVGSAITGDATTTQHITDDELGRLTVTYRVEPAMTAELVDDPGHDGDEVLLDRHGRPLELMYGLVTNTSVAAGGHDMARARTEAVAGYRRFLADEENVDVQPSRGLVLAEAVPLAATVPTPALPAVVGRRPVEHDVPHRLAPSVVVIDQDHTREYRAPRRPRAVVLGLLGVLLLAVFAGLVGTAFGGGDAATDVTVGVYNASERSGRGEPPACDDVRVVGTVAAAGATSTTYQWRVDGQPTTPLRQLALARADKVLVDGPDGDQLDATDQATNGTITRTYQLVVTEAGGDGREESDTYEVECTVKP